ncbi:MAG: hypothetical protein QM489_01860 [Candidatus Izemoplasma sp.]
MRELTFEGFLKEYTKELSLSNSLSIFRLEKEAHVNPRIIDVFSLLLLLDKEKRDYLEQKFPKSVYLKRVSIIETDINNQDLRDYLLSDMVHESLRKVYNSYLVEKNTYSRELDRKEMYRNKIIKMKNKKDISDYKIYNSLKINSGNFNSFFNHSELNKLSMQKVRDIFNFVESYERTVHM